MSALLGVWLGMWIACGLCLLVVRPPVSRSIWLAFIMGYLGISALLVALVLWVYAA